MAIIKMQRYCFFFMALMINLFNYSENTVLKLLTNISVLLFVAVVLISSNWKLRVSPAYKYYLVFFAFCVISVLFSTARSDSVNKLKTLVLLFMELMAVFHYATKEGELDIVLSALAVCTTVAAVYIVLRGFSVLQTARRVGQITGDSNQVSAFLVYGIGILEYLLFQKKRHRWIPTVGIVISLLAIALQGSRTAIVTTGFVVILESILMMRYNRLSITRRFWLYILVFAFLIATVYSVMTNPMLYMTLGRRIVSFYQIQTTGKSSINEMSTYNRMIAYRFALERFMVNPFFGRGIGSFADFSAQSVLQRYGFCPNNYLELLQGIGFFGTLFYYLIYLYAFRRARIDYKRRSNIYSYLTIGILAAMFLEHITVVFYYHKLEYLYLGVLLACCCSWRGKECV